LKSWEGIIKASLQPGVIGFEPVARFEKALKEGGKTQIRILAHPLKPDMVCRTLLKMGIEVVAADDPQAVFSEKFDDARTFALFGQKVGNWWYLQREDMRAASDYISGGITAKEWTENVRLEVVLIEDNAELFHLKLLYLDLFTPLESRIQPPPSSSLQEPELRLFVV
jgi:hypothetical protein